MFLLGTISEGSPVKLLSGQNDLLHAIWAMVCQRECKIKTEPHVRELAEQIRQLHHRSDHRIELTTEGLMEKATFDEGGDLQHWDLSDNGLEVLPETFVNITMSGNLNLRKNKLRALPWTFGSITIGGNCNLSSNRLETLPESIGNITVGGHL